MNPLTITITLQCSLWMIKSK